MDADSAQAPSREETELKEATEAFCGLEEVRTEDGAAYPKTPKPRRINLNSKYVNSLKISPVSMILETV